MKHYILILQTLYLNIANIYKYVSISSGNSHYYFTWLLCCRLNLVNSVNLTYMLISVTLCPFLGLMILFIIYFCIFLNHNSVTEMTGGVFQQLLRRKLHPQFTVSHCPPFHVDWMLQHVLIFWVPIGFMTYNGDL